ncbi:hypothetical protein QFZ53_002874 [Microbacterium natoriense]|uniref:Uncharacterized protein n=1 Tax=Microbacterium natoriense TaxID=284570 RepID=A0AAW8EZB9_9MICO|nr:hypothetical protein [Microbacterium natoriense]MDQ0648678.1 hypothetical protein [Microbacterium natoriense]
MSNPIPPLPFPDDADDETDDVPTREVDGDTLLDTDANQDAVDSYAADRLASEADDESDDSESDGL